MNTADRNADAEPTTVAQSTGGHNSAGDNQEVTRKADCGGGDGSGSHRSMCGDSEAQKSNLNEFRCGADGDNENENASHRLNGAADSAEQPSEASVGRASDTSPPPDVCRPTANLDLTVTCRVASSSTTASTSNTPSSAAEIKPEDTAREPPNESSMSRAAASTTTTGDDNSPPGRNLPSCGAHQAAVSVPSQTANESDKSRSEAMPAKNESDITSQAGENEIVIKSNAELWQQMKGSPIRVREITCNLIEQQQQLTKRAAHNGAMMESASTTTATSQGCNSKSAANTPQPTGDELIKAAERNNLDSFFNHYKGKSWRNQQLTYQIPSQDIKLLSEGTSQATPTDKQRCCQGEVQTVSDEIDFIRGQKRLASQFKASLYYLNPTNSASNNTSQHKNESDLALTANRHCCFKCKKPVEPGTTCVRVDNLMQVRNQQQASKFSSHENNNNKRSQSSKHTAIIEEATSKQQEATASGKLSKQNTEEKSSSDEGLGSGSSSEASSSAANSHCDDRETPPHMETTEAATSQSAAHEGQSKLPASQATPCDNLNELSIDSLSQQEQPAQKATKPTSQKTRQKSSSGGGEKTRLFSRKSRTLTWSASLGSLSASLKFGGASSSAKSRSDTNLEIDAGRKLKLAVESAALKRLQPDDEQQPQAEPIFFHNDCFNCATCNELLVDLRALIYVNNSNEESLRNLQIKQSRDANEDAATGNGPEVQSEYVNLPGDAAEANEQESSKLQSSQISLYCHRHFVELFKPRCQQCDCLILDEECTEAEGKVWHIKHFCCAECRVPLGGHQYIIVDQALNQARAKHQQEGQPDCFRRDNGNTNQPFCLKCFDKIFGETCAQCGKLITCDSGAINHESRSWHASADCFRCHHCLKSLLGCPFLPNRDGNIYCSIGCSEMTSKSLPSFEKRTRTAGQVNMSMPHYSDPRTMTSTVQHVEANGSNNSTKTIPPEAGNGAWDSLMRHKPLVDYLMMSAHSDETSYQLLQYLKTRFDQSLRDQLRSERNNSKRAALQEELKLLDEISFTLNKLRTDRKFPPAKLTKQQEQIRRDRLNPFLMDAPQSVRGHTLTLDQRQQHKSDLVCMMMDRMLIGHQKSDGGDIATKLGYMNIDSVRPKEPTKTPGGEQDLIKLDQEQFTGLDCIDRAVAISNTEARSANSHQQQQQFARLVGGVQQSKLSQCSPVASLISNEGTISDHSATSSGVSTAPPGRGSINGSLKSHSPLSSTSSHSSVVSSSSMISSTSAAPNHTNQSPHQRHNSQLTTTTTTQQQGPANSGGERAARQPSAAICSIAATLERRRRVQPITELSVVDLLAVADNQMQTNVGAQLTNNREPSAMERDGFDRLVSQFSADNAKRQQQQQLRGVGSRNSTSQSTQLVNDSLGQRTSASGKQQPYSFFFELAQRLPMAKRNPSSASEQRTMGLQVATDGPLDTNGLPTTDDGDATTSAALSSARYASPLSSATTSSAGSGPTNSTVRMITDHYSTVNKAHKQQQQANKQQQQQQMANDEHERRRTRDDFFAITSPLLDCQIDTLTSADTTTVTPLKGEGASHHSQHHQQGQMTRPTSSLSIFPRGDSTFAAGVTSTLQGSFSTNSLNRQQSNQISLQQQAATMSGAQPNKLDRPLTRPAKSVSFDPNVKDPPSSSATGRASSLKSALKQSLTNWSPQYTQDQLACHEFMTMMEQQHPMQIASSATMPASFASQLKAATGSMAAYNAYYDEFGRRIKLSTLLQQQQLQQQILDPTAANMMLVEEPERELPLEPSLSKSSSSPLPGGSLLAKIAGVASSRGGRREERKMRQESNQVVQTQPGQTSQNGLLPLAEFGPLQLQQSTSGLAQVQEEPGTAMQSLAMRGPPSVSGSSRHSRRSSSSQRRSSRSYRRYRRDRKTRSHHRPSSRRPTRCNSRHCRDENCMYDTDEDDYSSSCSTCSSSSSTDDNYTDHESERRRYSRSSRKDKLNNPSVYESDDRSSYTSYTSPSDSSSDEDAYDDEEDNRRPSTPPARSFSPSRRPTRARHVHRRYRSSCSSSSHHSSTRSRASNSSRNRRRKGN